MKKLYISLALLVAAISVFAQTPTISMTTTLSINSQISFSIRGSSASTPIQIDWGNGVKENYTIGDSDEAFGFPTKGSTIKIWGPGVEGFNIQSKQLTALEFYEATSLKTLFCKNNQLNTLNLTGCSALTFVECKQNLINSLTLPSTTTLTYVDCSDNNLTLSSLPVKQATWTTYIYSPQKNYALVKTIYAINEEIDLSSQLTVNGNTTTYTWKTAGGTILLNGVDYNVTGGKFTFLKTYSESIYCELSNTTFPSLTIKTINISILLPAIVMTTITAVGSTFSFDIGATSNNTPIQVDWGNGTFSNYTIGTNFSNISGTLTGSNIKIYGVGINSLILSSKHLIDLDVTKNTSLTSLDCSSNHLSTINLTMNTALISLDCSSNALTTLDITMNTALTQLMCSSNLLTTLDVSNNNALTSLLCGENQLSFSTLPLKKATWTAYTYSPQATFKLTKTKYSINEIIDLNSQLAANGNTTSYVWKTAGEVILAKDVDYIASNGRFTFPTAQGDYFRCQMTNATFPGLTLTTEWISVPSTEPSITMTTSAAIGSNFEFIVSSSLISSPIQVDWGSGSLQNYTIWPSLSHVSGILTGNTIKVYGVGISLLELHYKSLTALDVTKNTAIIELVCDMNSLTTLDVTRNRALTKLHCYSNQLTALDVTKNIQLQELICTYNQLTSLDVTQNIALKILNCGSNKITNLDVTKNLALTKLVCQSNPIKSIDVTKNTSLKELYCSENKLTVLDVTKNLALTELECSSNQLMALDLTKNSALKELYCGSNQLTFSTLPIKQPTWTVYYYNPQANLKLPKKNYDITETLNLSSQLTVNGNTTTYALRTKGGFTLYLGVDYTVNNGIITFLKAQTDSVYCQMTNATFPGLTLSTTNAKVTQFPTSIDVTSLAINIYPNPVKESLNIELSEIISKVEVYTIIGAKIFEKAGINSNTIVLPTDDSPRGILIVKVYGKNGVVEKKVLKE